jgi:hypothetical protein
MIARVLRGDRARSRPAVRAIASAAHFGALFATGLNTGVALGHVLEKTPKKEFSAPVYLAVQRNLYRRYAAAGSILEPIALAASAALAVFGPRRRVRGLGAAAAALTLAELGVWWFLIEPINRRGRAWTTPESLPLDWRRVRDRWEALHAVRAGITSIALGALILAAMRSGEGGP